MIKLTNKQLNYIAQDIYACAMASYKEEVDGVMKKYKPSKLYMEIAHLFDTLYNNKATIERLFHEDDEIDKKIRDLVYGESNRYRPLNKEEVLKDVIKRETDFPKKPSMNDIEKALTVSIVDGEDLKKIINKVKNQFV